MFAYRLKLGYLKKGLESVTELRELVKEEDEIVLWMTGL